MSRFFVVSAPSHENKAFLKQHFEKVAHALGGPAHWRAHYLDFPHGSFVWKGQGEPSLARLGHYSLVMDGAVYNYRELDESGQYGRDEARILLHLIERMGLEQALLRLNGDFAFALHDARDGSLVLVRDRMGVRPLYYTHYEESLIAASRPGAILACGVSAEVNRKFASLFAASHYRYIDNDIHASPYTKISQLPAAFFAKKKGIEMQIRAWWQPSDIPDVVVSEESLVEEYRTLFLDAVRLRLEYFSKPLFTLSGGMDSSAILAASRYLTGKKQEAISTIYEDATYDESANVKLMLEENVSQWHHLSIEDPDIFGLTAKMIAAHDEPVPTVTWLPHFLLCQKARELGVSAISSGLGGDEIFGGEYEHFFFYFADLKRDGKLDVLEREIHFWEKYHNHPWYPKNKDVAEEYLARLTRPHGICLPERGRMERYYSALNGDFYDLPAFDPIMDHPFQSYLKNRCWQDILRETSPCCIRGQDRHGMEFGLPVFMPFFDHRLVDMLFQVAGEYKIRNGVNKYLARKGMRGILPDTTCDNIIKTGWNAPAHLWFLGTAGAQLKDMVRSQSFRERGIYNVQEVERLIHEHAAIVHEKQNREHHMMFLWQVLNTELWQQWIEKKEWLRG